MTKAQTFKMLIDGEWTSSRSGQTFASDNPATDGVIGYFQKGTSEDAKAAIDAADRAFESWSETPAPKRGAVLFRVAEIMRQRKEDLIRLVSTEMGKPLFEARGEVQEAIDLAEYFGGEGRRLLGNTTKSELPRKMAFTIRMPVGVAACVTPWNFPISIPAQKTLCALVCGCPVVLKPSSDTPLVATEFVKILVQSGIPKGVINLVTGGGSDVGMTLVKSPKVRAISLTGHRETGAEVVRNAGIGKKVSLEMGSKNAIIVMDDADLDLALSHITWSGFGTTGQRCTAASRIIVAKPVHEKIQKELVNRARKLRIGPGTDSKTEMGPLVNKAAVQKVHSYTEVGKKEGAKLLTGGKPIKGKGNFYEPTVFAGVDMSMRIAKEEIFGPTISLIQVKDLEEAISALNSVEYGLSSSIFTRDINKAMRAIEKIQAGVTYINAGTIGAEAHLPFGGMKSSGNGAREAGIEGINEFTDTKTVYIDYSGRFQRAQIDVAKK